MFLILMQQKMDIFIAFIWITRIRENKSVKNVRHGHFNKEEHYCSF